MQIAFGGWWPRLKGLVKEVAIPCAYKTFERPACSMYYKDNYYDERLYLNLADIVFEIYFRVGQVVLQFNIAKHDQQALVRIANCWKKVS